MDLMSLPTKLKRIVMTTFIVHTGYYAMPSLHVEPWHVCIDKPCHHWKNPLAWISIIPGMAGGDLTIPNVCTHEAQSSNAIQPSHGSVYPKLSWFIARAMCNIQKCD